jgi:nucleotide-binding universal stress UspA family protein
MDAVRRAGEIAKAGGVDRVHVVAACHTLSWAEVERAAQMLPDEFRHLVDSHADANQRFAEASKVLEHLDVGIIEHDIDDHAAKALLDVSESVDADLLVVGARGLGAFSRFLRGSVSTRVAHHSLCDVLIVEGKAA